MKKIKKYSISLLAVLGIFIIFPNINTVNASDTSQEKSISYNKEINENMLEEIKTTRFKVLLTPRIKVQSSPTQEDISKYYYNQLTNDIAKNTYNTLKTQISNKVTVDLNKIEYDIGSLTDDNLRECFTTNLLPHVLDGYEAYVMDGAENYWWTTNVQIGEIIADIENGKAKYKTVELISNMEEWSNYLTFNTKLKEVSDSMTGESVYEIARSVNHYIMSNVEYTVLDDTDIEQTPYGALIEKKAVCEGQTQLFNLICRQKGLTCLIVYGYTSVNNTTTAHAWNYVYEPTKEQWYAIDVTWNNYYNDSLYFMVGSETEIDGVKFGSNHLAGFKQYKLQTYLPKTPVLSLERYINPITIDGEYIKNIQPDTIYSELLKEFADDITFTIKENNKIISDTDIIKTGQVLTTNGLSFTLVVTGDVNGDGQANIQDIMQVNKHRLNKIQLTNGALKAGDVNQDGQANIQDIMQINKYRLRKISEI
ncbi:MAG: hypothetical protein IKF17_00260 [Clostridia bacterium]|nr:hypothetical protein [Clostridia bacterium]